MSTSSKPRQPKLRQSCDGCFLAKVKCSKARPICSRCLSVGLDCRYSPSSRAGKVKSDSSSTVHPPVTQLTVCLPEEPSYTLAQNDMYHLDSQWSPPATHNEFPRSYPVSPGMGFLGPEPSALASAPPEMYPTSLPWTPPSDLPGQHFGEGTFGSPLGHHPRSRSFDHSGMAMPWWPDSSGPDLMPYPPATAPIHSPPAYFPSPSATPNVRSLPAPSPRRRLTVSCTCFSVCLQSLQALHNASSPTIPPLDTVLSLNRKAVEGCAAMLGCQRCMTRSGIHTTAMLLATVIGKITSFYKSASKSYFESGVAMAVTPGASPGPSSPPGGTPGAHFGGSDDGSSIGITIGGYQVAREDGRWIELQILARELRKLEEVYARFKEVCCDLTDDGTSMQDFSQAMVGYLGQTLGDTLKVVSLRRDDMGCA